MIYDPTARLTIVKDVALCCIAPEALDGKPLPVKGIYSPSASQYARIVQWINLAYYGMVVPITTPKIKVQMGEAMSISNDASPTPTLAVGKVYLV